MNTVNSAPAARGIALVLLLLVASGCSNMSKPGPQSVVGMLPDATVVMTEIIAVGAAGGKGTLTFRGNSYPFQLVGGVTGGGGAADTQATGEVYNLHSVADFKGLYKFGFRLKSDRQAGPLAFALSVEPFYIRYNQETDTNRNIAEPGQRGLG